MYKLFSVAGYSKNQVDEKFSGMINALSYGAPPHGGIAPGIDRTSNVNSKQTKYKRSYIIPNESKCSRFNDAGSI